MGQSDPSQQREKLCAQLSKSLGAVEADRAVQDAGRILSLLTMDGSRANIENGRNWMFSALQTPADLKAFLDYMLAVCNALPLFDGKLHMLYLLSDCLYHASHPQTQWIKRAAYPQLLYLVNSTYRSPQGSETDKQRVLKVLDVWDQHGHYSPDQMRHLREIITIEPPVETTPSRSAASTAGYPPRPFTEADNPREKFQRPVESQAGKKYYQLPVGSMLKVASAQRLPYRPLPSHQITSFTAQLNDALAVVLKEFYDGLETYLDQSSTQTFTEADDHLSHASNGRVRRIDSFGWQEGFLDRVYEQLDRKFKLSGSNGSRDRSYTYGDGDRQRSPPSKREKYSRSRSRSRSASPPYRRRRSRSPSYRGRRTSFSRSRSRSPRRFGRPPPPVRTGSPHRPYASHDPYSRHGTSSPGPFSREPRFHETFSGRER